MKDRAARTIKGSTLKEEKKKKNMAEGEWKSFSLRLVSLCLTSFWNFKPLRLDWRFEVSGSSRLPLCGWFCWMCCHVLRFFTSDIKGTSTSKSRFHSTSGSSVLLYHILPEVKRIPAPFDWCLDKVLKVLTLQTCLYITNKINDCLLLTVLEISTTLIWSSVSLSRYYWHYY